MKRPIAIDAPHFYAGLEWKGPYVSHAAPIIKYMVGWNAEQVEGYVQRKGWKIVEWQE